GPHKTIKQRNIAHTSASHVAAKGGDSVSTLAIGQLPYQAFSSSCLDSGRSAAPATSPTGSAIERKTGIQARSKKSRLSLSGPSRGYTSGGPVGPTEKSPGATMRLRAFGGGP